MSEIEVIGTRGAKRADYAPSETQRQGAWIAGIEEGSPAWEAGLEPGMRIAEVNGEPLRDLIDWRWNADGDIADLVVFIPEDDEPYEAVLEREPGEDWGVDFEGVVFDGIINATRHLREAQAGRSSTLPQKLPSHYRISLHVDDEAIVVNLGRQYGYNVIQIDAPDDGWKEKIIAKAEEIRHREFDQQ